VIDMHGGRICTQEGCTSEYGLPCAYIDRRGRRCPTAWCPEHRVTIDSGVYCRRHAGVLNALPDYDASLVVSRPDLDNRAPSLVAWVSREIDTDVWRLLLRGYSSPSADQLVADPVTLVYLGFGRQRAWERAWRLTSHLGITHRVSIVVVEEDDTSVLVKVGDNTVARLVPPWIQHRAGSEDVAPRDERREREDFYASLLDSMERGLEYERSLSSDTAEGTLRTPRERPETWR
jgi:hypothetical protein